MTFQFHILPETSVKSPELMENSKLPAHTVKIKQKYKKSYSNNKCNELGIRMRGIVCETVITLRLVYK